MAMGLYRRLSPVQSRYLTEDRESIYLPLLVTIGSSYCDSSMKKVLGVVRITGKKKDRSFSEMDLHLLMVVGGHIGLAVNSYLEMGEEIDARVQASLQEKSCIIIPSYMSAAVIVPSIPSNIYHNVRKVSTFFKFQ